MRTALRRHLALLLLLLLVPTLAAQDEAAEKQFTIEKTLPHTSVKNQGWTGTCWSFCTISLIESELMRQGKGTWELAEMFPVYYCYPKKAELYIRTAGNNNFDEGGIDNDVLWVIDRYGIVPRSMYTGMWKDEHLLNHSEMTGGLRAFLDTVLDERRASEKWPSGFRAMLDTYMRTPPAEIEIDGKKMTPKQFSDDVLGIDVKDYVGITSFLHLPMEGQCEHYLPDNWLHHADFYNVPLDDFMAIIDTALERGFTVSIGADTSERSYYRNQGYADWREGQLITPEERQRMWDSRETQDDHGMHIVGLAHDEDGRRYYYTKNSHGKNAGPYEGYVYLSPNYVRAKVNSITVHKDALTTEMRERLRIK